MATVNNAMYSNSRLKFVKAQLPTRPGKFDFILQSLSTDSTMDKGFLEMMWEYGSSAEVSHSPGWSAAMLPLAAVIIKLGDKPNQKRIPEQPNSLY